MTDAELVEGSQLIVMATYIGSTQITLKEGGQTLHLGVLDVDDALKGNMQEVVFLQLPSASGQLHKSDDIFFRPGQKGLWFLKKDDRQQGIYKVDHPQRFIPEQQLGKRIAPLLKLLGDSARK